MSKQLTPTISPIDVKQFTVKQSKYSVVGKLPIRSIILGPSGSGKTILLQNMILDIYKDCFSRIYIFSPSIEVDLSWQPVKQYIEKNLKIDPEQEQIYFDHYDSDALENIISTQHKITNYMKKNNSTKLFQILVIVDDMADDPSFTRHSKLLHALYTRGRHNNISTITATQKFAAIANIIRVNATELYVYRLRNYKDLETFIEEVSAIMDKKIILDFYNYATSIPYGFLYVKLTEKNKDNIFYQNFQNRLTIQND
jgi:hypothetical protein